MTRGLSTEMIIAGSAVLISAASFYLAWKQTEAMDAQVKAMSWPFLQIESGNYDVDSGEQIIYLRLTNAGVGPAHVRSLKLFFDGRPVAGIGQLLRNCCVEPDADNDALRALFEMVPIITGDPSPAILSAGSDRLILSLPRDQRQGDLWDRLDTARWKLSGEACYCSILEECWVTDFEAPPQPVDACDNAPEGDWRG